MKILFRKDPNKNKLYFGLARNDGQELSSSGTIAEIDFAVNEDGSKSINAATDISIKVSSLGGIRADGSTTGIKGALAVTLGPDIELCEGETATLQAPSGFDSYSWSSGATTSSITVSESGTYSVTVTDTSGVTGTDNVKVTVHDNPVIDMLDEIEATEDTTLDAGSGFATYSWTTGESTQTIEVTESGTYTVTVTSLYGCSSSHSVDVTIKSAGTGINGMYELSELSIYPNPAEDMLNVEILSPYSGEMVLELVDQNGARFYRQKLGKTQSFISTINVSELARGIYYLQVIQNDKVVGIKKIAIH